MDSKVDSAGPVWTTNTSAVGVLGDHKQSNSLPPTKSAATDQPTVLPRKHSPTTTNLHETLVKSVTGGGGSSSSSSPTSSVASSRITAINLHHHNNLLATNPPPPPPPASKKSLNAANINGSSVSLWQQQHNHHQHQLAPFGSGGVLSATRELVAASSTISGLGIGGSTITLQASERTGSVAGRETPFSFLANLTSANRLNCLGGSSPGGAGDHSPSAYWKHQQQQFHNSTSTYPHSTYNGGGGGGGGGANNSSGGNQKVNI